MFGSRATIRSDWLGGLKKSLRERVVCWKDESSWFLVLRGTRGIGFYLT